MCLHPWLGSILHHTQTSNYITLDVILSLSLQSTLREREGKEVENSSIFKVIFVMQWFEGDIKITIMYEFIFMLNYENDVKITKI